MCQQCDKLRRELETIQAELRLVPCNVPVRRDYYREYYQRNRERKLAQYRQRREQNA